jgi:hypothetical protein
MGFPHLPRQELRKPECPQSQMPLRLEVQESIDGHPFVRMLEHFSRALRVLRKEILREEIQTV